MRKIVALLVCILLLHAVFGQSPASGLKITHLTGDFYIYTTYRAYKGVPFPANAMYLLTNRGVVMFDTPWDTTQFQPLLDSIKLKHNKGVILCIATHFHEDRTCGLEFLTEKGIKTYTTRQTDELSIAQHEKRAAFLMDQDTVFNVGGHRFQTYYGGPGHSADNIVIWFEKEKILYGGCLIKSTEATDLGNLTDANVKAWPSTIKNIQHKFKNPKYTIPGHQDWTGNKSLAYTLQLLTQYNERQK